MRQRRALHGASDYCVSLYAHADARQDATCARLRRRHRVWRHEEHQAIGSTVQQRPSGHCRAFAWLLDELSASRAGNRDGVASHRGATRISACATSCHRHMLDSPRMTKGMLELASEVIGVFRRIARIARSAAPVLRGIARRSCGGSWPAAGTGHSMCSIKSCSHSHVQRRQSQRRNVCET